MGHYNSEIELVFPSPPYAIPILAVNYSFHNGTNMHLSGELSTARKNSCCAIIFFVLDYSAKSEKKENNGISLLPDFEI